MTVAAEREMVCGDWERQRNWSGRGSRLRCRPSRQDRPDEGLCLRVKTMTDGSFLGDCAWRSVFSKLIIGLQHTIYGKSLRATTI